MNADRHGSMRFGLFLPNAGYYAAPHRLLDLAHAAEESGWDGVFIWDHLLLPGQLRLPVADSWTVLTAILSTTEKIVAGPLVTPVASRHPWKVARETVTLDHLSNGRLVLGVGLGGSVDTDFVAFGDHTDATQRAARVDEFLTVVDQLWSGQEVKHDGEHFVVDRATFLPGPIQAPRIPVWVAIISPVRRPGPVARALRWDGVVPMTLGPSGLLRGPDDEAIKEVRAKVGGPDSRTLLAVPGELSPADRDAARRRVNRVRELGATWWLESFDPWSRDPQEAWAWARQGPPSARDEGW
jgi:alkanesulfonate monooxygenase SsuD/methylene tetrahydromethanopterin reductase-like flavin-dependent oxidoreductase (luciferase family)